MDSEFLNGLQAIKKADPEKTVEEMYRLFRSVEDMEVEDVVAAKHTLDLFRSLVEVGEVENKILDRLNKALTAKAKSISSKSYLFDESQAISLRSAFG